MTDYGDIQIVIALVNHQKQPGTIKCSMQYVLWEPDLLGEKVEIPIENVKSHKISPDGKAKVQIQIITKDAKALVSKNLKLTTDSSGAFSEFSFYNERSTGKSKRRS